MIAFLTGVNASGQEKSIFQVVRGTVNFHSNAREELIRASTTQIYGIVDIQKKTFAFKVTVSGFEGFNSSLQKEHFDESYLETGYFPEAAYSGKIIEDVDLTKDGSYEIRSKGKLKIHGVEQERIIRAHILVKGGQLVVTAAFIVPLADHNIKVPRVVYDKVAPEINVSVTVYLSHR
jgi:hypothetical protein